MDILSIIGLITAFIAEGGLVVIMTLKFTRSKAQGEARQSNGDADRKDIDNLRSIIDEMKEYYNERIEVLEHRIEELEGRKCEVLDCPHRIPPIKPTCNA